MENRKQKGLELFKAGKIQKLDKNSYVVEGTKKYFVRKVSDYWSCTCEDHFYRLNICKHIEGCKEYEKNELTGNRPNFFNNKFRNLKIKQRAINEQINKVLRQNKEHMKLYGNKSTELSKKAHRLHKRLLNVESELKKYQKTKTVLVG